VPPTPIIIRAMIIAGQGGRPDDDAPDRWINIASSSSCLYLILIIKAEMFFVFIREKLRDSDR